MKIKTHLRGIVASALGLFAGSASAITYTVDLNGYEYTLTNYLTDTNNVSMLESTPWFGSEALASQFASAVQFNLGPYYSGGTVAGVLFYYAQNTTSPGSINLDYWTGSSVTNCSGCMASGVYFADIVSFHKIISYSIAQAQTSLVATNQAITSTFSNTDLVVQGSHSHPISRLVGKGKKTFWVAGDLGTDNHGNRDGYSNMGEIGGGYNFGPVQINLSLGKTWSHQNLDNYGSTDTVGKYVMVEGIIPVLQAKQIYATLGAYQHWGDNDIIRGYDNLGTADSSWARPGSKTWGLRARLDWVDAYNVKSVSVSPYVDLWHAESQLNGYTETGGAFPATFDKRSDSSTELRLGTNLRRPIGHSGFDAVVDLEGAHRFNANSGNVSGSVGSLFSFNLKGQRYQQDWLRGGVGVEGKLGKGKLSLMVNATTKSDMPDKWLAASYQLTF